METCKSITDLVCKNCIFGSLATEDWNDKTIEYVTCMYNMDTKSKKPDEFCGKHGEWIVEDENGRKKAEWRGDAIFFILNRSDDDK